METLTDGIAIFFVLHFCWSYYWNCYRKGYTIDVWHFGLLNALFVIHIMLPFARSPLNVIALGGLTSRMQPFVTEAYLVSALGYACILVGATLWRFNLGVGFRHRASRIVELPIRGALMLLRSRALLTVHGLVSIVMLFSVVLFYFSVSGFGFNVRGLLITYPAFRPIAQFAGFYSVLIASHCLARYAAYRERSMIVIVGFVAFGLLFFGERSALLALAMLTIQVSFLRMGRRLKFWWLGTGLLAAFVLVFLLNLLRSQGVSANQAIARFGLETFYGNSFSDTRDFALVLSFWDHRNFYGLTYLAGLFAFVPRALSSFRDTWSVGVVTATMAGFSPTQHPGFRVGTFGEMYLNFGLAGVVIISTMLGAAMRLVDLRMKQAVKVLPANSLRVYSYSMIPTFLSVVQSSVTASMVYTILLILGASWVFLQALEVVHIEVPGT